MGIVEEECDESLYRMEMLVEADLIDNERLAEVMKKGGEIPSMVVASIHTARFTPQPSTLNPQSAPAARQRNSTSEKGDASFSK